MKCPHCGHTWGNPRKAEASKRHKLRLAAREESERTGESYDEIVQRWGCEKRPNPRSKHANPNTSPSSHSRATGHH
jgi:hypothetical protein